MNVAAGVTVFLIWLFVAAFNVSWVVMACLKAGGMIDWSWWIVLSPLIAGCVLPSLKSSAKKRGRA